MPRYLHDPFFKELRGFGVSMLAPKQTISHLSAFSVGSFEDTSRLYRDTSIAFFSKTSRVFQEQNKLVSSKENTILQSVAESFRSLITKKTKGALELRPVVLLNLALISSNFREHIDFITLK